MTKTPDDLTATIARVLELRERMSAAHCAEDAADGKAELHAARKAHTGAMWAFAEACYQALPGIASALASATERAERAEAGLRAICRTAVTTRMIV